MIYGSVCSGIEAASVAWEPLGWRPAFFSEIEAFPRAVLEQRFPAVPRHGDFTTIEADTYEPIDLLVGGTPCQDFSVAGLRKGLAGERGNLTIEFVRLAGRLRSRWLVWENVPGVLSIDGGRAFGAFLGGLGQFGYGFAYRVLDAQHFGVPQRRRRVFVVGYLGDWRPAAAVLFEPESLRGDSPPRRGEGQGVAGTIAPGAHPSGFNGRDAERGNIVADIAPPCTSNPYGDHESREGLLVTHSLRADGFDASEDGTGRGTPLTLAIRGRGDSHELEYRDDGIANAILTPNGGRAGTGVGAVAFQHKASPSNSMNPGPVTPPCDVGKSDGLAVQDGMAVRRLTPVECEKLQGFPDVINSVTILACSSDQQKTSALAEIQSHKLLTSAFHADENESRRCADHAAQHLNTSHQCHGWPVVLRVRIDLERSIVELHKIERLNEPASDAERLDASRLPLPIDAFVRLVALLTQTAGRPIPGGRAASQPRSNDSSALLSGNRFVAISGHEITDAVGDAKQLGERAINFIRSTTSQAGSNSLICERTPAISSCFVMAAISGFIPGPILRTGSYAVKLEAVSGYTAVTYRGKPAADGPRYRALGNSMAVPCMAWIGRRIEFIKAVMECAP